jgi:acetyl esterase/lipase
MNTMFQRHPAQAVAVVLLGLIFTTACGVEVSTNQSIPENAILLWPNGAPGAVGDEPRDKPNLTVYAAPKDKANGAALVICPGGGYGGLAVDHEGKQIAEWANSLGMTAFVLRYRLGTRYHHPAPLRDVQRAIRIVRTRAADWQIDPKRVGVIGFSAGGHLASTVSTHFDSGDPAAADPVERANCRPDFAILCYPVITMSEPWMHKGSQKNLLGDDPDPKLLDDLSNDKRVTDQTPPTFIFHTSDDSGVPVENSVHYFLALRKAKVPAEMHLFEHGRHGVGLAPGDPALSAWPPLCESWLRARAILPSTLTTSVPATK